MELISFVIGVISLGLSIYSIWSSKTTKKALEEQSNAFYEKSKAREIIQTIKIIQEEIQKHQTIQECIQVIQNAQVPLYELKYSIPETKLDVDALFDMVHIDYQNKISGNSAKHTSNDYIDILSRIKYTLERKE